ncbi:MAG: TolC family protein, partial [Candidatus Cloacimonetes bacterium]|nr:TolC family protein [Candidatus Cloacimonadota bacterium]
MKGFRLALLLAPLLVSCTMAPRYMRPEALVPGSWPEADSLALSELAAVSQPSVEEFYRDPRLRSLLELTREHNLDLRLATLNAETVRAYYRIERANLLPAVNAIGAGSKHRSPADLSSSGSVSFSEQYSVQAGISSWELDLFGRLRSLKNEALENYFATREGERAARLGLVAAVGQAWLGLAASQEQLQLARETEEAADS